MMDLDLAERMAVAVLRRDKESLVAARALADVLLNDIEDRQVGEVRIPPVKRFSVSSGKFKVVVYYDPNTPPEDMDVILAKLDSWMEDDFELLLPNDWRIELYEIGD